MESSPHHVTILRCEPCGIGRQLSAGDLLERRERDPTREPKADRSSSAASAAGSSTSWHRLFWALATGMLPLSMLLAGGLQVSRVSSLIASFPVLFAGVAMAVSLVKSLRHGSGQTG